MEALEKYEPERFLQEAIGGKRTFRIEMQNADLAQSKLYDKFNNHMRKIGGHLSLSYSILFRLHAPEIYLEKTMLESTVLQEADLSGAYLKDAVFGHADLQRVILKGADVEHCDFAWANLEEADLTGIKNIESASGLGLAHYWNTKADKHTQKIIENAIAEAKEDRWADSEKWIESNKHSLKMRREMARREIEQMQAQRYRNSLDSRFIDCGPS